MRPSWTACCAADAACASTFTSSFAISRSFCLLCAEAFDSATSILAQRPASPKSSGQTACIVSQFGIMTCPFFRFVVR